MRVMGEVQLEVLARLAQQRFGLALQFDEGGILYKETIASRWRAWGIPSLCAITPRCTFCWNPPRAAAGFIFPARAARTCWTKTGSA